MANMTQAQVIALVTQLIGGNAPAKGKKGKAKAKPSAPAVGSDERKTVFAAAAVKAAEKAGYTNNIPNETLLTYGKWEERGMIVKKGQKAIRVKAPGQKGSGLPLFHISQVEPVGVPAPAVTAQEQTSA